ncbi:MAG: hypothetical protein M1836_002668 [Candelina mexicana]|nr:MAG: hypothetical protein M1836_002668 [Candelina mexicana]
MATLDSSHAHLTGLEFVEALTSAREKYLEQHEEKEDRRVTLVHLPIGFEEGPKGREVITSQELGVVRGLTHFRFFPLRVGDTDNRPVTERMKSAERDKITARFFGWTEDFNVSPQRREHPMPPALGFQRNNLEPDNFSTRVNDFSFYRYRDSSLKDSGRSVAIDGNIDPASR